jgi:hypothetical protein
MMLSRHGSRGLNPPGSQCQPLFSASLAMSVVISGNCSRCCRGQGHGLPGWVCSRRAWVCVPGRGVSAVPVARSAVPGFFRFPVYRVRTRYTYINENTRNVTGENEKKSKKFLSVCRGQIAVFVFRACLLHKSGK